MRTIKFRGKSMLDGRWVTGDLVHGVYQQKQMEVYCIADGEYKKDELDDDSEDGCDWGYKLGKDIFPVHKETIGQYTGMNDKHGREIYEGDIVRFDDRVHDVYSSPYTGEVVMYRGSWRVKVKSEFGDDVDFGDRTLFRDDFANRKTEILGNVFDNQELIKQE